MESLPYELVVKIFEFLPISTLAAISPVNKRWRAVTTKLLYTIIDHLDWKPRRVTICLQALSSSHDGTLSNVVRHLDLRLWSIDPAFSLLLVEALMQTKHVVKLRLSMSDAFAQHFETHLLQHGIIAAWDAQQAGDSSSSHQQQPELWSKHFLPHLEELELSSGYKPFQLAAGRPVRCVSSPTHMEYHSLEQLLPFFRQSRGPVQTMHFNLTGRDTNAASKALKTTARMLPYLTHVFFNIFVSRRAHKYTPDLLEDLSTLSSLHSVELLLSRSARSPDQYLFSHFAALHTLKATASHLTQVVIDTIRWQYRAPTVAAAASDDAEGIYGWSPLPSDVRTHEWWLEQYGDPYSAHAAMLSLWKDSDCCIPALQDIGRSVSPTDYLNIQNI